MELTREGVTFILRCLPYSLLSEADNTLVWCLEDEVDFCKSCLVVATVFRV